MLDGKAYDSNVFHEIIANMGPNAVIPSNRTRKVIIPLDAEAYKQRKHVECCFNRLKNFCRFTARYKRRTIHFKGFALIAAIMIWLRTSFKNPCAVRFG